MDRQLLAIFGAGATAAAMLYKWMDRYRISATAAREGISQAWTAEAFLNALRLATQVEKARDITGGTVTSMYRSVELNRHPNIRGNVNSKHLKALATDIDVTKERRNGKMEKTGVSAATAKKRLLAAMKDGALPSLRRVINEGDHLHLQWAAVGE